MSGVIRRARKEHTCSERSHHVIKPGDLYFHAVLPPWHEFNTSGKFWVIKACLTCAERNAMLTPELREQQRTKSQPAGQKPADHGEGP